VRYLSSTFVPPPSGTGPGHRLRWDPAFARPCRLRPHLTTAQRAHPPHRHPAI